MHLGQLLRGPAGAVPDGRVRALAKQHLLRLRVTLKRGEMQRRDAVLPLGIRIRPFEIRKLTRSVFPSMAARCRGVEPSFGWLASTLAPLRMRRLAISTSPRASSDAAAYTLPADRIAPRPAGDQHFGDRQVLLAGARLQSQGGVERQRPIALGVDEFRALARDASTASIRPVRMASWKGRGSTACSGAVILAAHLGHWRLQPACWSSTDRRFRQWGQENRMLAILMPPCHHCGDHVRTLHTAPGKLRQEAQNTRRHI